ncbi:MFS transporter [Rhizobium sp. SL86]|uniref:MFS transporter n=1 Tax=Rhizobium sp. SL86 TaxID=2995148 RepID=UPI003FA3615A
MRHSSLFQGASMLSRPYRFQSFFQQSALLGRRAMRSATVHVVAALSVTQLIGWGGMFYLPAVTGPAMAADLGLALPLVMAGPTVMLIVMAMVSWPLGAMFERHGARPIMLFGSILGSTGLLIIALASGPASYFLSWVILGLAGASMLTTPAQIAVMEIAGDKTRQALSALILAGGLTSTIVWPFAGLLQAHWGWRTATLTCSAIVLGVCTPLFWSTLARRPKAKPDTKVMIDAPRLDRLRFALFAVSFALNGFVTWGFALTIIVVLEASGLNHSSALTAAAFIGIAQWAGRLVDLVGGRRLSSFLTGLVGSILFPLSFIILVLTDSVYGAMLFATLYGVASGITAVTRATLPLQIFPPDAYARASARLAVPLNLAFASAPPAFTAILVRAGPHAAIWLAFGSSILAVCALFGLWRLQLHQDGKLQQGSDFKDKP